MWTQVGASIATFLTTGGFVLLMFKRQQNQIDSKVTKEFCGAKHDATNKILDELRKAVKDGSDNIHKVHVMVERIDAKLNGGSKAKDA